MNFFRYPEETNDCCLFLSTLELERSIEFVVSKDTKKEIDEHVAITKIETDDKEKKTILTNVETSAWAVQVNF